MKDFSRVLQPIKVGPLWVRNRTEVSPAEAKLATWDGHMTEELLEYYTVFAKHGAGIVTIGDSPVTKEDALERPFTTWLTTNHAANGLFKFVDAMHRYGALASIELNMRDEVHTPTDYTKEEIHQIIKCFADAAERCRKAGFDMVMLHAGHGHVLHKFLNPYLNKRTDEYGCDTFENRCRLIFEVTDAVRKQLTPDMAIEMRISGDELTPNGVGLADMLEFAKAIQHKIDLLHVSCGNLYDPKISGHIVQRYFMPMGKNLYLAEQFKKVVDIPVNCVGSISMEIAEDAIAAGKTDMVAMIRHFIADNEQVEKAESGRGDEIRPCLRCGRCNSAEPHVCPLPLRCSVNAIIGRSEFYSGIPKAETPKKVVIVGGGCAGMEAARRLVERGHHPVLFEMTDKLGGSLPEAGANPIKINVKNYTEWSIRMTERLEGIDLRLGVKATPEMVHAENPDALFVAIGAAQIVPNVPGIDGKNVCMAVDYDTGRAKVEGKKVIVVGAGPTGCESAVTLKREGHEVTIIDMGTLADVERRDYTSKSIQKLLWLEEISVLENMLMTSITDHSVIVKNAEGETVELPCDNVVLSLGMRAKSEEAESFRGICRNTLLVGDCKRARNIKEAVTEAFYAVMQI